MFSFKKRSLIGVDINHGSVKVLELSRHNNQYCVEAYGVEALPKEAIIEDRIVQPKQVISAIRKALASSKSKAKEAAAAVPGSAAMTKIIAFPNDMSEREIEDQILLESDTYIPYPLQEIRFDFQTIGVHPNDPDLVEVLLVASRREHVDSRADVLSESGLKATLIDMENYTIQNAFTLLRNQLPNQGQRMTVAIADIGELMTTLYVLAYGKVVFSHEQAFGGHSLQEESLKMFNIPYADLATSEVASSLPEGYLEQIVEPFKAKIARTIARGLHFFSSAATQYQSIDYLLLSGDFATIQNIDNVVEIETGIPTALANPFSDAVIGVNVKAQGLVDNAPNLLVASGLALRQFDQ